MTQFVIGNFFATELTAGVTAGATTLTVPPSSSLLLPAIADAEDKEARLTLWDGIQSPEIVACTLNEQNGTLTVIRAREDTTARAWPSGTQVISALTAEVINAAMEAFFDFTAVLNASFLKLTGGTLTGALLLHENPSQAMQAVTKQYADTILGDKLPLTGGTMAGSINMNNNRILSLPAPATDNEPATKIYADAISSALSNILSDRSGSLITTGTSAAYVLAPAGSYASLTDGISVTFRPHVSNVQAATLNFAGFGAKAIQLVPGTAVTDGFFLVNQPITLIYVAATDIWLLVDAHQPTFDSLPGDIKHSGRSADHGRWLLCDGRAVSRSGATLDLFNQISNLFGSGNGSTTFNIPDLRGRVIIGKDNMGGASANRAVVQIAGGTMGATGGVEQLALTISQLPAVTPAGTVTNITAAGNITFPSNTINAGYTPSGSIDVSNSQHDHDYSRFNQQVTVASGAGANNIWQDTQAIATSADDIGSLTFTGTPANAQFNQNTLSSTFSGTAVSGTFTGTPFGSGVVHSNCQPSIVTNAFVRF